MRPRRDTVGDARGSDRKHYGNVIVFPVGGQRTDVDLSSIVSSAWSEGRASAANRRRVCANRPRR
jgi:hypothetical protein